MFAMTPWVRRLLVINIAMALLTGQLIGPFLGPLSRELYVQLLLYPPDALVRPWTLVTYMFLHAGLGHLLFNMIGLFFFGPRLEMRLGSRDFLILYILAGIGGAVLTFFFQPDSLTVGASGAVLGVLMGFAMFWPRERIYIWGVLPVEAWLLVGLYVFMSVSGSVNPAPGDNTAHFAHLGGLVFAFVYLRWRGWRVGAAKRSFQQKLKGDVSPTGYGRDRLALARWKGISVANLHELNRGEVERLVLKAERDGPASLTESERAFLDRMSRP